MSTVGYQYNFLLSVNELANTFSTMNNKISDLTKVHFIEG